MKNGHNRTSVSISKQKHALITLAAHAKGLTVGRALEAAIDLYAGNPAKLAREAVRMTVPLRKVA
jgi:hypothetical protein